MGWFWYLTVWRLVLDCIKSVNYLTLYKHKMSFDFITKSPEISEANKSKILFENASNFYGFNDLTKITPIKNML